MSWFRFSLTAVTFFVLLTASPVGAIEFRAGDRVVIAAEEIIPDDLYVTGDSIVIDGVVQGDIVAAGRHIVLNGASFGDFIAAGQGITVNGQVADDVRIAGFALRLGEAAAVGDDVIGAGFSLEATKESLIAGSLVFSGFQALIAGEVREKILGQMGSLRIEGIVGDGGEVAVEGGQETPPFIQLIPSPVAVPTIPAGLTIAETARVSGDIVYTSSQRASPEEGSRAVLTHVEVASKVEEFFVERSLTSLWRFIAVLIVGIGLMLLVPGWLWQRVEYISKRPLAATGWGLLGLVGIPVLMMLLAVVTLLVLVLLGFLELPSLSMAALGTAFLSESSLLVGFIATLLLVAPAILCLVLGRAVSRSAPTGKYFAFGLGWVLLALLFLIPILGGLARFVVVVLGLGAIVSWATRPVLQGGG